MCHRYGRFQRAVTAANTKCLSVAAEVVSRMPGSPHRPLSPESASSFDQIWEKTRVDLAAMYGHKHTH